jgi:hypothetical protein
VPDADKRRLTMAKVMIGAATVALVGSFLPWASAAGDEGLGGFSWGPGKVTAVMALLLGLYAAQVYRRDDPRVHYHGWAIAAVTVGIITTGGAISLLDEIDSFTLGVGDIEMGTGLLITFVALCFAIWPLVVLRKDDRRREFEGLARSIYAQGPAAWQAPPQGPPPQAPAAAPVAQPPAAPAGWHPDPTGRFEIRYFDGANWTDHVARGGQQATDPVVPVATAAH